LRFEPCLLEYGQINDMNLPEFTYDEKTTERNYQRLCDCCGDILNVVKGQPYASFYGWGESMIDHLVEMRGLEQIYYDLADNPEWVCAVMEFMTRGKLRLLDSCREAGLLISNNCEMNIGSTSPGYTNELPALETDQQPVSEKELWGYAQAQEFSEVSSEMLEKFILPYQARIINRFGLSCYGCCEAMENKIDAVAKHIKNLRMISISPFADALIAAEKCRNRFVYAWKPQPSHFVNWDEEALKEDFVSHIPNAKGCCLTISMMDNFYFDRDQSRYRQWVQMARKMVDKYYIA